MRADEIKDRIRGAFPAVAFNGVVTDCNCEECTDIRLALEEKRWDEVPREFIDFTCSPALLTPEAFCAFLAAYMLRALDLVSQSDGNVVEFTVYSLIPGNDQEPYEVCKVEWRLRLARLMNAEQIQAVRRFLLFVTENSAHAEWLERFIRRALDEVWK